jgi:predicted RNA-binding protein YlqC (UPF0109 family)
MDAFNKRNYDGGSEPIQPAKRSSATLSLLVSNEHAGAVIGPKGTTVNAVRESTGCRCAVESTPTPENERIVTIAASSVESATAGVDAVLVALFTAQTPPTTVTFLIAPQCVGALIGKSGTVINGLRSSSGCDIRVQNDSIRVLNTYARCDMSGDQTVIRSAAQQVTALLYDQYTKEDAPELPNTKALLSPLKHVYPPQPALSYPHSPHHVYASQPPNMYGQPYDPMPHHAPPSHSGTLDLVVPTSCLGNLIGKGGKYFNGLRESYGVELKVESAAQLAFPTTGEPASTLTIIGHRDQLWVAAARCISNLLIGAEDEVPRAEMIYLDPAALPRIIGKNGSRINLIRSASKCKVNVEQPQPGAQVASCILEGTSKEILCARILIEVRENSVSNTMSGDGGGGRVNDAATIELVIPKRFMGQIIGKSGKYINATRHATNCNIQVAEDTPAASSNGEVMSALSITGNPAMVWNAACTMVSYLLVGKTNPDEPDGLVSETLQVPNEDVGQIIGKGGARINAFRQATGCKIQIEQNESSAVLALEGSSRSVLAARVLVTARELKKNHPMLGPSDHIANHIGGLDPIANQRMLGAAPMMPPPHNTMVPQPMGFGAFGGPPAPQPGHLPMGMFGGY